MGVKPILKYGLIAGALALPGAAYPLGLGKLTVESYVGQPLVARIELLASTKEELDTLTAKIAEPSLRHTNSTLPFLRAFARDLPPAVRELPAAILAMTTGRGR